jgi:hypothetical protein
VTRTDRHTEVAIVDAEVLTYFLLTNLPNHFRRAQLVLLTACELASSQFFHGPRTVVINASMLRLNGPKQVLQRVQ